MTEYNPDTNQILPENTHQALTQQPMQIVRRYLYAFLGGFVAMAGYVFMTFRMESLFHPARIGNAISAGLLFGILMGVLVLIAAEYPDRLRGLWQGWARWLLALGGGTLTGLVAWWAYTTFFLLNTSPDWLVLLAGAAGLSAGFAVSSMFRLPGLFALAVTTMAVFLPVYITGRWNMLTINTEQPFAALLYFDPSHPDLPLVLGMPFAMSIAIGGHLRSLREDLF